MAEPTVDSVRFVQIASSITGAVTHAIAAAMGTGKADKAQEKGDDSASNAIVLACCLRATSVAVPHLPRANRFVVGIAGIPVCKESFLQASIDAGKLATDKKVNFDSEANIRQLSFADSAIVFAFVHFAAFLWR